MNKQEIKNIINSGWLDRRLKQKLRNKKNSALVKAWKLREAFLEDAGGREQVEIKRENIKKEKHLAPWASVLASGGKLKNSEKTKKDKS